MPAPTDISGLVHRFRASQLTGLSNGGSVSSAAFETGGVTLSQATSGNQPVYVTSSINGLAGLRFNGSNSVIASSSVPTTISQPFTISLVLNFSSVSSLREIVHLGNAEILINDQTANTYATYVNSEISGGTPTAAPHVLTVTYASSGATIYVDGTSVVSGNVGAASITAYTLGAHPSAGRYFSGDVAEINVYNGALSAADRATLHTYVKNTYAISTSDAVTSTNTSTSKLVRATDLASLVLANINSSTTTKTVTSTYTVLKGDRILLADSTGGSFTATLPTAVGFSGIVRIISSPGSSNVVTIATTSSQTIDGALTKTVGTAASGAAYLVLDVVSNGANWRVA